MAFIVTPNMNLIVPGVGTEPGPLYASDINSSLTLIDQHNHSIGQGVQITPSGLNINADLTINGNNLTTARTIRFQPQSSDPALASDLGILYEVGVDLYYRDGSGNAIRITQSGSVSGSTGTITGLPSGTASAAYSSGTFIFQSATLTAANIDGGSYIFRNGTASSFGLTLQPPNAMAADYTLTLPSLPVSTKIVTLDTSGNLVANYDVDNSTLEVSSNTLQIKNQGVTQPKLAPRGLNSGVVGEIQLASSSGAFSTTNTLYTNITNQTISVNVSSSVRPVKLVLTSDASPSVTSKAVIPNGVTASIRIINAGGSTVFGSWDVGPNGTTATPISLECYDFAPTPGSNSYIAQLKSSSGVAVGLVNVALVVYEI